jgi:hypothetical protein
MGHAMVKGFALEIGNTYGSLIKANLSMQYQLSQYFAVGGGVKSFFLDLIEDELALAGVSMDSDFFRPAVYVTHSF